MKEFLLLFRGGGYEKMMRQTPEEFQKQMNRWRKWMDNLSKEGSFVAARPLNATGKQVRGTLKSVTDCPFAEGKEIVGGYLICKADSYDGAVRIAKGCPVLDVGGVVEVRELTEMKDIEVAYSGRHINSR